MRSSFAHSPAARAVPAVLYAAVLLWVSVTDPPAGTLTATGPLGLVGVDKWVHALSYAVLAVLLAVACWTLTRRVALAVSLAVGYGASIELVQSTLPYRTFGPADLLANAVGAGLVGVALWVATRRATPEPEPDTSTPE